MKKLLTCILIFMFFSVTPNIIFGTQNQKNAHTGASGKASYEDCMLACFAKATQERRRVEAPLHAITYKPESSQFCRRFGNHIHGTCKAKWLSYKYKIPYLLIPFEYAQDLTLFNTEKHASPELIETLYKNQKKHKQISSDLTYKRIVNIDKEADLISGLAKAKTPTLFVCNFNTQLNHDNIKNFMHISPLYMNIAYSLALAEPEFGKDLKKILTPINPISIDLPKNRITVAMHVRKGGGFDGATEAQDYFKSENYPVKYQEFIINNNNTQEQININAQTNTPVNLTASSQSEPEIKPTSNSNKPNEPNTNNKNLIFAKNKTKPKLKAAVDKLFPTKLPPNQYYIDQIIKLSEHLNNAPLYVYFFTDDQNPAQLVEQFKKKVNKPNIIWEYRTEKNAHDLNVIDDFYVMSKFDCLIRSTSYLSLGSAILGSHKISISPANATWIGKKTLLVDKINWVARE
ncbi:MAG: hypothetical protein ABH827_02070 [bacterium]